MIPLINQALTMGYTAAQVLGFLGNKIPNLQNGIQQAVKRGYSDQDILKFLAGKIPVSNKAELQKQENDQQAYLSKHGIKSKQERQESKGRFIKGALGTAATAASAMYAYKNYGGLLKNLRGAMGEQPPQGPQGGTPQQANIPTPQTPPAGGQQGPAPTPSPMQQTPGQTIGAQVQSPGGVPNVPAPPQGQQPQMPQIDSQALVKQMGLEGQIENMRNAGNDPEAIAAGVEASMRPEQKKWLQSQTQAPVSEVIKDYLSKNKAVELSPSAVEPSSSAVELPDKENNLPDKEISKEQAPLKVGSEVITPDGDIANIEALPGKTAKINSEGKKKVYETDDLTPVPENKDEILSIYDKLIQAIPESARSTMVSAIGYDAKNNKVQVKFHDGTSYNYENIDQEDIDSILNLENLAKTTGGNYFGVHFEGEPSLGAGMSKLIKRLQEKYGGKGKEYSAKFKEVYSLYAIPEGKRREREKAEREAKKKAKRNA